MRSITALLRVCSVLHSPSTPTPTPTSCVVGGIMVQLYQTAGVARPTKSGGDWKPNVWHNIRGCEMNRNTHTQKVVIVPVQSRWSRTELLICPFVLVPIKKLRGAINDLGCFLNRMSTGKTSDLCTSGLTSLMMTFRWYLTSCSAWSALCWVAMLCPGIRQKQKPARGLAV